MSQPAVKIEGLSKKYKLGLTHSGSIRDLVNGAARRLFGKKRRPEQSSADHNSDQIDNERNFWALNDVSFDVQPGEVIGIIGKNGAGKSTLLKILSQITKPTEGRAVLRGRVASLLEVGTGFHPELTGRENVYLNGTILGMKKREVDRRFDEIVAFAGVEEFIDTPVKRYSSGMTVRLGFAVAAHLDPEILIIDEVLAVGDAEFQRRCVGKMKSVAESGRTVLFVSHNMESVRGLTSRAVVLRSGSVRFSGPTVEAVRVYIEQNLATIPAGPDVIDLPRAFATNLTGSVTFTRLELVADDGGAIRLGDPIRCRATIESQLARTCVIGLSVLRADGTPVGSAFSGPLDLDSGETRELDLKVTDSNLSPGRYCCSISISDIGRPTHLHDRLVNVLPFTIAGDSDEPSWQSAWGPVKFPSLQIQGPDE